MRQKGSVRPTKPWVRATVTAFFFVLMSVATCYSIIQLLVVETHFARMYWSKSMAYEKYFRTPVGIYFTVVHMYWRGHIQYWLSTRYYAYCIWSQYGYLRLRRIRFSDSRSNGPYDRTYAYVLLRTCLLTSDQQSCLAVALVLLQVLMRNSVHE